MKYNIIFSLLFFCYFLLPYPIRSDPRVKIVYETDMESDIDDAAALALLHALADNGECEIMAVMQNTSDDYGVGVIDAINTYYGRPDIPIGAYKLNDAPSVQFGGETRYAETIAKNKLFPKDIITRADIPDAVELYKKLLQKQRDQSVTIVSVGWKMNLQNILRDKEGAQLIKRKISKLVLMGGKWDPPDSAHKATMNLAGNQVIEAAYEAGKYVIDNWPTDIIFSGGSIGGFIRTGEKLKNTPATNPVREAYRIYKKKHNKSNWNHPSWDQTAVLFAVRGKSTFWNFNTQGTPKMFLKPNIKERYLRWHTMWDSSIDSNHAYMKFATDIEQITNVIEDLMIKSPTLIKK